MAKTTTMHDEEFFEALTALENALAENGRRASLIKKRIAHLRRLRAKNVSYSELVGNEDGPLIVHLLTESSAALDTSGANFRRAEAKALHAEGQTMEQIAESFGVTRQRVSALLRKGPQDTPPNQSRSSRGAGSELRRDREPWPPQRVADTAGEDQHARRP